MNTSMRKAMLSLASVLLVTTAAVAAEPAGEEGPAKSPYTPAEIAAWAKDTAANTELGHKYPDAWALYTYFKDKAKGGTRHTVATIPDWSGLWTRDYRPGGRVMDALQEVGRQAVLTPEYDKEYKARQAQAKQGILYDPLSSCEPAGFPRWLTSPFMRDYVVTPNETWLTTEQMNEVRRIYTDGRDHIPEADRYPLWLGDSIGFWDGPRLVVHTNQLREGIFARNAPRHSDQVEVVEVWERISATNIDVDVWIYDKLALKEPLYLKVRYVQQPNDDKFLRIRHWECTENPNNQVIQTETGASDYRQLDFGNTKDAGAKKQGAAKKPAAGKKQ